MWVAFYDIDYFLFISRFIEIWYYTSLTEQAEPNQNQKKIYEYIILDILTAVLCFRPFIDTLELDANQVNLHKSR